MIRHNRIRPDRIRSNRIWPNRIRPDAIVAMLGVVNYSGTMYRNRISWIDRIGGIHGIGWIGERGIERWSFCGRHCYATTFAAVLPPRRGHGQHAEEPGQAYSRH